MGNERGPGVFTVVDVASRDPDNTHYYGGVVQVDMARFLKDPKGAGLALQAVIEHHISETLETGAAKRAGMERVPDTLPQTFQLFDSKTGAYVLAWRVLCRRREPEQTH